MWVYKTPHKWVLNFPTKKHWRSPSKPDYLEAGLKKFSQVYQEARITSISFPQLGCGNGELDWKTESKPLMEKYLKGLPIEIFIHVAYSGVPDSSLNKKFRRLRRSGSEHSLNRSHLLKCGTTWLASLNQKGGSILRMEQKLLRLMSLMTRRAAAFR